MTEENKHVNEKDDNTLDFSHLSDDNPVKKLCMEHPSLSTCQRFLKTPSDEEDSTTRGGEDSLKSSSSSIASYIKGFTRWMNSCIYSIISNFVEAFRSLVKVILSYTIGVVLSIGGKSEVCKKNILFFAYDFLLF